MRMSLCTAPGTLRVFVMYMYIYWSGAVQRGMRRTVKNAAIRRTEESSPPIRECRLMLPVHFCAADI